MIAGGGIQGGRVVGNTGPDGLEIQKNPVPIQNLYATIHRACGLDPNKQYNLNGRKVKYAYNGTPVNELF